jgi:hypothetical protein
MMKIMASAETGSAHHQPNNALRIKPTSAMEDKYGSFNQHWHMARLGRADLLVSQKAARQRRPTAPMCQSYCDPLWVQKLDCRESACMARLFNPAARRRLARASRSMTAMATAKKPMPT